MTWQWRCLVNIWCVIRCVSRCNIKRDIKCIDRCSIKRDNKCIDRCSIKCIIKHVNEATVILWVDKAVLRHNLI